MTKLLTVLRYEYMMQMRRFATWGVLVAAITITQLECFPSEANSARLEFLPEPAYFLHRIISQHGLLLIFGLMFLLSNRFSIDDKTGMKPLFMVSPMRKVQYISGKLMSGFLYALTILLLFIVLNMAIYAVFNPAKGSAYISLIPKLTVVLPMSVFTGFCAVALPAVMDIRLFYFILAGVFIANAAAVGSAEEMPFYLITSGDMMKWIWQHPKFPFMNSSSMMANGLFLIGCGCLSCIMLVCKRKFWRAV